MSTDLAGEVEKSIEEDFALESLWTRWSPRTLAKESYQPI